MKTTFFVAALLMTNGCANTSKTNAAIDCEQPLNIIIGAPEDKVSEDGFTIFVKDIKIQDAIKRLTNNAIKIQNSYGCKNSLEKLLNN
jgi:hypothetical protein